ncbi:MAG TPA: hypothetical protein VG318_08760 [Actinomycetota bacterium]|nr:hypothetical protein [Actinomycetota bacterium]
MNDPEKSPGDGTRITVLLAQLDSLRAEVYERTRHQHALVGFQVTSVAAVVGVVATGRVSPYFLTVLVFTSSGFNLFWLDHHKQIARLGFYLGRHVEEPLNAVVGDRIVRWDSPPDAVRESGSVKALFRSATGFIFLVPSGASVTALAATFENGDTPGWMVLVWVICVLVFAATAWATYFFLFRYTGAPVED